VFVFIPNILVVLEGGKSNIKFAVIYGWGKLASEFICHPGMW
jgi:hypothetical protein